MNQEVNTIQSIPDVYGDYIWPIARDMFLGGLVLGIIIIFGVRERFVVNHDQNLKKKSPIKIWIGAVIIVLTFTQLFLINMVPGYVFNDWFYTNQNIS